MCKRTLSLALVDVQGNHLETPSGLPGGESAGTMGFIHRVECWETGTETVPQPGIHQSEEGTSQ